MIGTLGASPGTSSARQYAGTMAGFCSGLSRTLHELELIAAEPRRLDPGVLDTLRALQYRLHWSSELLVGVVPPAGARAGHEELANALVHARDATGEIADALEAGGGTAAWELLFEWRGALFRVRLARMRLTHPPLPAEPPPPPRRSAAVATMLTILGAVAFAAGAVLVLWPVWAAGLALVAGGLVVHRP
jgi:hypothetical protein